MTVVYHQRRVFSGTSLVKALLQQHSMIAGHGTALSDHEAWQDEGQHLQYVYPTAEEYGGMLAYGFAEAAHMTEMHSLVTDDTRAKLYTQWSYHWNVSKPVLLEKSPPNIIKTRFLQAIFGLERSHFIIVTRHPLGASYFDWRSEYILPTCGKHYVKHWLQLHRILREDLRCIHSKIAFVMENFSDNIVSQLGHVFEFLGLPPLASGSIIVQPSRRRLLDLHVSDMHFTVVPQLLDEWVEPFRTQLARQPQVCAEAVAEFEEELSYYGYSIADPGRVAMSRFVLDVNKSADS